MDDAAALRAIVALVSPWSPETFERLRAFVYDLSAAGRSRLDIMGLLWAAQIQEESPLEDDTLGQLGDFCDALLGQCLPAYCIRLAGDPEAPEAFLAAVAADARRWQPPR